MLDSSPNPKVLIIGAGLAGLTAAYRLQEKGHDVHVYEARQRPGGRVLSVKIGESYDELGGKNFNDCQPDNALKLMRDLGFEPLYTDKSFKPNWVQDSYSSPIADILEQYNFKEDFFIKLERCASQSRNLEEVILNAFEGTNVQQLFMALIQLYEGSHPRDLDPNCIDTIEFFISLFLNKKKEERNGKPSTITFLTLKGGNAQLPLRLSEKLKNKIHYGKVLTTVQKNEDNISLTFNKDLTVKADIVLLTIPCSVFEDITFDTHVIPAKQLSHIQSLHYGTNGKILLPIHIQSQSFNFTLTSDCFSWDNEDAQILTLYTGGNAGFFDAQKANARFKKEVEILKRTSPNVHIKTDYLETPTDYQFAPYKNGIFKSWALDPFSKGSYSNRAPGTVRWLSEFTDIKGEKVRTAFQPINEKLFFAGEHTTTLDTFGTMESAIESGERMARLIDKTLRK